MASSTAELTHSERPVDDPTGWVFYLSHMQPRRLVVFVHGFNGRTVESWQSFPDGGSTRDWWRESDLLFVGYDSRKDDIAGVAHELRSEIRQFFPNVADEVLRAGDARIRPPAETPYQELLLVGHSLGGLVVRRALCDEAHEWIKRLRADKTMPRPALLDAKARLFSPASAGFRPAGWLGLLRASRGWTLVNMQLSRSPAFADLQPKSDFLEETRRRTESLHDRHESELAALEACVAWARPDNVVLTEYYDSDESSVSVRGTSHKTVCKPNEAYQVPWLFVETGKTE